MQPKLFLVHFVFVFVFAMGILAVQHTVNWYGMFSVQSNAIHTYLCAFCILYLVFVLVFGIWHWHLALEHTGNWYGMLSVQNNAIWTLLRALCLTLTAICQASKVSFYLAQPFSTSNVQIVNDQIWAVNSSGWISNLIQLCTPRLTPTATCQAFKASFMI